jgi:alpha-L-fucosidase
VVRDVSEACERSGLRFGIYLSPWDRNHPAYAHPEYVTYYRNQLRELLQDYGPVCEVWFDGANGGDGYYGGARERREIDRATYYEWEHTWQVVRELQPEACIFSDAGPDVRWVGNERGVAGDTCWATLDRKDFVPGLADRERLNQGDRYGGYWLPAECDVSIRPGWFYHPAEDADVRSPENLLDLYFQSVGRGASLLLNLPPDRRGRIHENDVCALQGFRRLLDQTFAEDLARRAADLTKVPREGTARFGKWAATDGCQYTYWYPGDDVSSPELVLTFSRPIAFSVIGLREYLPLGQRVEAFAVDAWQHGSWEEIATGTSIGSRRLVRFPRVETTQVRLRVTQSRATPALSELSLWHPEKLRA